MTEPEAVYAVLVAFGKGTKVLHTTEATITAVAAFVAEAKAG